MFLTILGMRTRRVLISIYRSLPKALAWTTAVTAAYLLATGFADTEFRAHVLLLAMLLFFIVSLILCTADELSKYSRRIFHRFDENIIGSAFTGLGKKSMFFEKGLELFDKNDFSMALEVFTDLREERFALTQKETAVNEFYRGRCYDFLGARPNALLCYETARENGFDIPELPIFIGRCLGANGSTAKAEALFMSLMREGYQYRDRMRFEIGSVYLKAEQYEKALEWFTSSIENRERYADSLGGAALASVMLGRPEDGEKYFRQALINNISSPVEFTSYFRELLDSAKRSGTKDS